VETDDPLTPAVVNGPAANIASSGPTGVHNQTVHTPLTPADVSTGHRPAQPQSIISVDETVPYSRGVDRSELLSSKSLPPLLSKLLLFLFSIFVYSANFSTVTSG